MQSFGSFHFYLSSRLSILRSACITEAAIGVVDGQPSCFFTVNTPGVSGIIPASAFGVATPQLMVSLEATAEASSVEQTIMGGLPDELVATVNAKVDHSIIAALETCGDALAVADDDDVLGVLLKSDVTLGNNEVPIEDADSMFALIMPDTRSRLLTQTEFASGDYVNLKHGNREYKVWRWAGKNWVVGPSHLDHSYIFHRHALGHALDLVALSAPGAVTGGIDQKTGVGWMKAKTMQLATILNPNGIVRIGGAK